MDSASKAPLVTIAIPTYNRAEGYLRSALESALAQTYRPLEVIVADNCSTDGTTALVQGYCDPRIRYFRHETPLAPNDNFNFCVAAARGRYMLLLHDDDLVDPDFAAACMAAASEAPEVGIVRTGTRIIDSKGTVVREAPNPAQGLTTAELFDAWFKDRIGLYLCSTLYNTEKLRAIGGFHSRHNLFQDDVATVTLAARHGHADIPGVKASFRVHGGELTNAARLRSWCEDSLDLLEQMCGLVPDERREETRRRGMRFFAAANYARAARVAGVRARLSAFLTVYRCFGHRYPPSARMLVQGTRLHAGLRRMKRRALRQPEWVAGP